MSVRLSSLNPPREAPVSDPTQDAVRELTIRAKSTQGETRTIDALIAAVRAEERQCLNALLREERKLVRAAAIRDCVAVVEACSDHDSICHKDDALAALRGLETP